MTDLLVLGATGMVGQAVVRAARARDVDVVGVARSGGDLKADLLVDDELRRVVSDVRAPLVINCAALVNHTQAEEDPALAYALNARLVGVLAEAARDARIVHVSTDQFWTGDGDAKHAEDAPVRLVNEYARSKFAGEAFALTAPDALVVRTNVTGLRGDAGRPTFIEWVFGALEAGEDLKLFDDFYTSTMAAPDLADALLDLIAGDARGLLNVASSEVSHKQRFILAVAAAMGLPEPPHEVASVVGLWPPRAESLGLDVSRAEAVLQRPLPDLEATARTLVAAHARA